MPLFTSPSIENYHFMISLPKTTFKHISHRTWGDPGLFVNRRSCGVPPLVCSLSCNRKLPSTHWQVVKKWSSIVNTVFQDNEYRKSVWQGNSIFCIWDIDSLTALSNQVSYRLSWWIPALVHYNFCCCLSTLMLFNCGCSCAVTKVNRYCSVQHFSLSAFSRIEWIWYIALL